MKRFPPLPRIRPVSLAGATKVDTLSGPAAAQPGTAPPVTMVPVVPLE
jgi:hypothetical protein